MLHTVLSLDFGGTKLAAGLVDVATGRVLAAVRAPSPPDAARGYDAMLGLARGVLAQAAAPPRALGVSFGGPVDADGRTVRLSMHVPGWEAMPLADRLEADVGLPCAVANDGDAAALAEHRYGAGHGVAHMLYLTVSTGIGGGVVISGQLYRGARAWAGEVGHQVLDPAGPPCDCGRNGCLESLASGRAVAREARVAVQQAVAGSSALHAVPLDGLDARAVAEAAAAGDGLARQVWEQAMGWLGLGVANAANVLNPARVVLGGGLTQAGSLLFAPVRRVVAQRVLDAAVEVVPAALHEHVGLAGGAAVAAVLPP